MKSSSSPRRAGYGQGMHAGLCRTVGTAVALAKLNYIRLFRLVELYQPMLVPERYAKYVVRMGESSRSDLSRYEYVVGSIGTNHMNGGHVDVGCQFGVVPLLLSRRGLSSIGIEYQYFSYLAAKELAYISDAKFTQIVNADITEVVDRVPVVESISMLSILHHIAQLFDDNDRYAEFLAKLLRKCSRVVVMELASPDEGEYGWTRANRNLCGTGGILDWHVEFLRRNDFKMQADPVYFDTHLGGKRPIIVAAR